MTEEEKAAAEAAAKAAAEEAAKKAAEEAAAKAAAEEEEKKKKSGPQPTDAEAKLLKEVMALKAAAKAAEDRLKVYEGLDPEEAKKAIDAAKAAERKTLEEKGEYQRIVKQMAEEHQKALAAKDKEVAAAKSEAENHLKTINKLTVGANFGQSKFINENLVLTPGKAEALYGGHFEFENGALIPFDKPKGSADRTRLVDAAGQPLTFEAAIEKIIGSDPDYERLKKSSMKPGANSSTNDKTGKEEVDDQPVGMARIMVGLAERKK